MNENTGRGELGSGSKGVWTSDAMMNNKQSVDAVVVKENCIKRNSLARK